MQLASCYALIEADDDKSEEFFNAMKKAVKNKVYHLFDSLKSFLKVKPVPKPRSKGNDNEKPAAAAHRLFRKNVKKFPEHDLDGPSFANSPSCKDVETCEEKDTHSIEEDDDGSENLSTVYDTTGAGKSDCVEDIIVYK